MSFLPSIQWQRIIFLVCIIGLLLAIPIQTARAQDPETTEQENNDRLLVAAAVISLIAIYAAIFVAEDADSRGKDGFQWGIAFFIVVVAGPLIYYVVAEGNNDDKLISGLVIFAAVLNLALGVYYRILRPRRFRLS